MRIRRAEEKDIPRLIELLREVLALHADLRPDLFIKNTAKYTFDELKQMLKEEKTTIFVSADENDAVLGYAMCEIQGRAHENNMTDILTLYVDDLCVDPSVRGSGIASALFEEIRRFAEEKGCYNVTLNVWSGNERAEAFYRKMGMRPKSTTLELILK